MANIEYGPLVSRITGKVGGMVFRGNGPRGILQAHAVRRKTATTAQAAHRAIIGEARVAYRDLDNADRLSLDFSVSEGYMFRKDTGGKFGSGLAGFTAWYMARRYTGNSTAVAGNYAFGRVYQKWADYQLDATAGAPPVVRLLCNQTVGRAYLALWMARAKNTTQFPSRPVWQLVYPRPGDPALNWQASGEPAPFNGMADFGAYCASRLNGFDVGSCWAYHFYYCPDVLEAYSSGTGLLAVQAP